MVQANQLGRGQTHLMIFSELQPKRHQAKTAPKLVKTAPTLVKTAPALVKTAPSQNGPTPRNVGNIW